jgi:prolipoprotein diacylglyceryltransferase
MHLLQYIHWDPDPTIFGLRFRWYGLLFASSFFFGYIIFKRFWAKERLPEKWLESLTIYTAVSTVVGARLGHCFFYDPGYYLANPIDIFKIWEGGLASHGAAVGIILGMYIWSRRIGKRNVLWILDRIVIGVALSGLTIRVGNLMNSEILGKPTTASYGFVFPQADQGEALRAKWEGDQVAIEYRATPSPDARLFEFYRSTNDSLYQQLAVPPVLVPPTAGMESQAVKLRDISPGTKAGIHYLSAEKGNKPPFQVPNADSLHPRIAYFEDPFAADKAAFGGRWEGDKVHLKFDMRGLVRTDATRGVLLLRSDGGSDWVTIHKGVLGGSPRQLVLDTLDFPAGIPNPHYKLVVKEDESHLVARQPAQLYEAGAYTLIFIFLLWFYYRHDGKVPLGRFFGLFLILVFGMRFLIEFGKEEQAEFMEGAVLNMGQVLSVPFVLLGVFFTVRSYRNPQLPGPLSAEDEALVQAQENKKK